MALTKAQAAAQAAQRAGERSTAPVVVPPVTTTPKSMPSVIDYAAVANAGMGNEARMGGNVSTGSSAGITGTPVVTTTTSSGPDAATVDAFAAIKAQLTLWGIPELADFMTQQMQQNIGPEQATINLRNQPAYKARFAGNALRVSAGLNALSEADYLRAENQYSTLFQSYGLKNLDTKAQFATLIGNDVSNTELNSRLDLAVNQVQNADPTVLATLKQYYPGIGQTDLVSYFLAPAETLPMLQQQVNAADVGAAAAQNGLTLGEARANQLAKLGVTYAAAQTGYGKVAEVLPTGQKLSQIYGAQTGIDYNQTEAEKQYLLNQGAAKLEQGKLNQLELAQFSGRSGVVGANAASGYAGSLGKSIQGKF
jgi:hypothetical protein